MKRSVQILARTPATVEALLSGLSDEWLHANEGPDTWSPFQVLGHLIHGEETDWIPRMEILLEHGEARPFEPFDRFAHIERFRGEALGSLLEQFAARRRESLIRLEQLIVDPSALEGRGVHPELGPVQLSELLATWVVHDLGHLAQISRVMARQLTSEVGPWAAFLPVLSR
jgi:hypothetical protein